MTATTLRLRTRLAGISTAMGGLLLAVPPFLGPPNNADNTQERLEYLANHPGPQTAKTLVFQAAVLLLLPGVVAIVGRVRGRGSFAVISGGVVYAAGLVGAFSFVLLEGIQVAIAESGTVTGDVVRATDAGGDSAVAIPMFVLTFLCFHLIGLPWLTFALVRARMVPWTLAILASLGTVAAFMGSGTRIESVGWVLSGGALAWLAYETLSTKRTRVESAGLVGAAT